MHNMTALWVPPNERSRFMTAYLGKIQRIDQPENTELYQP